MTILGRAMAVPSPARRASRDETMSGCPFNCPARSDSVSPEARSPRSATRLGELGRAQRSEARANFLREEVRLFPRREVTALVDLVVMDQLGIGPLGPTPRSLIRLA